MSDSPTSDGPITRLFPTHTDARQAAERLHGIGIASDQLSLIDQHGGGTLLTVTASADQAGAIGLLLPDGPAPSPSAAPPAGMDAIQDAAPGYAAGAAANLGTPGPD